MQKFLLFFILPIILGCTSTKKEEKANRDIENVIVTEEVISKPESENKIKDSVILNELSEAIDSITTAEKIEDTKNVESLIDKTEENKIIEKEIEENTIPQQTKKIKPDHSAWDALTKKYVSSSGKVNYNGFKSNISQIETYLSHLEVTFPQKNWSKNEKLSYWFNLYNAATVYLVASSYPVKSIKDINNGKPWDKKFIKSNNRTYSLNDIENKIVRPYYNEPRLHVAFNCAAISCPKLMKGAFIPTKLNSQLNTLSKAWINDSSKNKVTENTIEISKIFDWYGSDFKKGVIPFINTYASVKANDSAKIQYLEYNWDLND